MAHLLMPQSSPGQVQVITLAPVHPGLVDPHTPALGQVRAITLVHPTAAVVALPVHLVLGCHIPELYVKWRDTPSFTPRI